MDGMLRLTKTKKSKLKGEKSSMTKKRRRAGSIDATAAAAAADDPLKRLAAFREHMFDMKHDEKLSSVTTTATHGEDAVVLAKWKKGKDAGGKYKKRRTNLGFHDDDEDDAMPRITVKKVALKKKDKVKKKGDAVAAVVKSSSVSIPGGSNGASTVKQGTVHAANATTGRRSTVHKWKQETSQPPAPKADLSVKPKKHIVTEESTVSPSSVVTQDQLALFEDVLSFEDPLEKAMQAVKEQMEASSSEKKTRFGKVKLEKKEKQKTEKIRRIAATTEDEQASSSQEAAKVSIAAVLMSVETEAVEVSSIAHDEEQEQGPDAKVGSPKKAKRKRGAVDSLDARAAATTTTVSTSSTSVTTTTVSIVAAAPVPSPQESTSTALPSGVTLTAEQKKILKKAKQRKSRVRANSVTLTVAADGAVVADSVAGAPVAKLQHELVVQQPQATSVKSEDGHGSDESDEVTKRKSKASKSEPVVQLHPTSAASSNQTLSQVVVKTMKETKPASAVTKKDPSIESPPSPRPNATKRRKVPVKSDIERPRTPVSPTVASSSTKKKKPADSSYQEPQDIAEMNAASDDALNFQSDDDESDAKSESTAFSAKQIFSNLIDEAARQQWDLVEIGRLVKLFSGQWGHKKAKTARFLRRFCPELVNIDFLEGLGMSLGAQQLVKIFERGSGNAIVLMNKLASAIENGDLNVREPAFLNIVGRRVRTMATNHEVLEFLIPLLESLSSVRDVSQLLKHVCAHWHVDRTCALVQQILLTSVFDDMDGNQDEILKDLPQLERKLDFPSRLDQEDADENGNLIGLIANEDSDLGEDDDDDEHDALAEEAEDALGEIHSDEDDEEDEDEEPYEGESDSDEEHAIRAQHQPKRRSRFILDEADEDDGEEDDELETEEEESSEEEEHGFGAQRRGKTAEAEEEDSSSDSEDETWRSKPKS